VVCPNGLVILLLKYAIGYTRALAVGSVPSVPGQGKPLLRECLLAIHKEIITCWNFGEDRSDSKVLF
jgi:hypothetical protein